MQTQARLSLLEKLDSTQNSLKTSEAELFGYRTKVNELETRLSKGQRTLLNAENQYRDQLTERNTLLLTVYQHMDNILGVDACRNRFLSFTMHSPQRALFLSFFLTEEG